MKSINKKNIPKELARFNKNWKPFSAEHSPFDDLKNDYNLNLIAQTSLAEEQGYICCYCMQELPVWIDANNNERPKMKIEHYKPKSFYDGQVHQSKKLCEESLVKRPDLRVDYTNLLAACMGNPHCDDDGDGKGDRELCYIPNPALTKEADFNRILELKYNDKGRIYSSNNDINKEIGGDLNPDEPSFFDKGILNLNHNPLRIARETEWKTISRKITKELGTPDWNSKESEAVEIARKYRNMYRKKKSDGKFFPYPGIVIYMLEKRFKELKSS